MVFDGAEEKQVIEKIEVRLYEIFVGNPWHGYRIFLLGAEFPPGGILERAHAISAATGVCLDDLGEVVHGVAAGCKFEVSLPEVLFGNGEVRLVFSK